MILELKAPAKINWFLNVTGRREDGFHSLETIFQSISLADDIRLTLGKKVSESEGRIRCICRPMTVHDGIKGLETGKMNGPNNIAYQAAALFGQELVNKGIPRPYISIDIKKRIPMMAGLAGGSSDAAAVLRGLNILMDSPLSQSELEELACQCGSDVLFCLNGGTQWGEGTGSELTPLAAAPEWHLVIVRPVVGVSTVEAYRVYDELKSRDASPEKTTKQHGSQDDWVKAFADGEKKSVIKMMSNSLEAAAISLCPEIAVIKEELIKTGCLAVMMSGSGSAVFALVKDEEFQGFMVRYMFKKGFTNVWAARTSAI
ncbi:MAG: 4-(cytidine 5'-diphospho)-2-C-methyl-D-erythritol kinase [Peptococcaceae bacterium]|nr:4-(cytidine 5'-diphospho)-2-C-methyl-D-erythritol kinase [Peptococcaceae bacterium]